jgi:hypothetical protein
MFRGFDDSENYFDCLAIIAQQAGQNQAEITIRADFDGSFPPK